MILNFQYMKKLLDSRFSLFYFVGILYIVLASLIRIILLIWSAQDAEFTIFNLLRVFFTGFIFDLTVSLSFLVLYLLFLLVLPKRWIGSLVDKCITYFYITLILITAFFSLIAELPFWDEFGVRFNFIAVDYLIYTYEVISNINQSYPIPLIIFFLLLLIVGTYFLIYKLDVLKNTFTNKPSFRKRAVFALPFIVFTFLLLGFLKNKQADFGNNLVMNEIGKNGAFSFFAAFRSNELDYHTFYPTLKERDAMLN